MKHHLTKKNIFLALSTLILACIFIFILIKGMNDAGNMIEQYKEMEK